MVDEHSVTAVGQVKGHVLISQLTGRAAVLVPHVHHLAVFDKGSEALAQPVDALPHPQGQLLMDEAPFGGLQHAHSAPAAAGDDALPVLEFDAPVTGFLHAHAQPPAVQRGSLGVVPHHHRRPWLRVELEGGPALSLAFVMRDLHADHLRHGRRELHGDHRQVERVAAVV